mmetsp:Transcript_12395/g.30070  ORF Transcript_12395/g.30070 Transcript_12395/m.30070 type:complete len:226 (-) Transcript_12395:967-1644(-)
MILIGRLARASFTPAPTLIVILCSSSSSASRPPLSALSSSFESESPAEWGRSPPPRDELRRSRCSRRRSSGDISYAAAGPKRTFPVWSPPIEKPLSWPRRRELLNESNTLLPPPSRLLLLFQFPPTEEKVRRDRCFSSLPPSAFSPPKLGVPGSAASSSSLSAISSRRSRPSARMCDFRRISSSSFCFSCCCASNSASKWPERFCRGSRSSIMAAMDRGTWPVMS